MLTCLSRNLDVEKKCNESEKYKREENQDVEETLADNNRPGTFLSIARGAWYVHTSGFQCSLKAFQRIFLSPQSH